MKGQKGLTLLEVVMAVALFAIIAAGLFMALNVSHKVTGSTNRLTIAESLTRSALEFVKSCDYDDTDPPDYQDYVNLEIEEGRIPVPPGYSIYVYAVVLIDPGIQKITVEVKFEGELIVTTVAYKLDR